MDLLEQFKLLSIVDSKLIDQFAPELAKYRTQIKELLGKVEKASCTACEARKVLGKLGEIQTEMSNVIESNPAIKAMVPQFFATLKG
jgi:hypothetical protein